MTLLLVLFVLLGGAIVNIAVAWGCAMRDHLPFAFSRVIVPQLDLLDDDVSYWEANRPAHWPARPNLYEREMKHFGKVETVVCAHTSDRQTETYHSLRIIEAGFPLQSMQGGEWIHGAAGTRSVKTFDVFMTDVIPITHQVVGVRYVLPTQPRWGAYIANTVVYALLLYVVLWLPVSLWRRRRRQHD